MLSAAIRRHYWIISLICRAINPDIEPGREAARRVDIAVIVSSGNYVGAVQESTAYRHTAVDR